MQILFATTTLPVGRITGGEVASAAFVDAMRDCGHSVTVAGYRRPGSSWEPDSEIVNIADRPIESREAGWRAGWWLLAALATGDGYSVAKFRSRAYRREVAQRLVGARPDVVVIDHSQMGWLLPSGGLGVPTAFIAHNIEHQLYADAAERAGGPMALLNRRESRCVERLERRLARVADRSWALSEADAKGLAGLGANAPRAFRLPPAVAPREPRPTPAYDIGLLGTWSWELNEAGLLWFFEAVYPRLDPSTSIAIAGAGSERFASPARPNVRCLGRVDDAAAFLASSRVVAIPAVASAGVQIKTLDAIASGSPVVATTVALRGIDDPPAIVDVADDGETFAATAMRLLSTQGPATAVAEEASNWVAATRARFRDDVVAELDALVRARP